MSRCPYVRTIQQPTYELLSPIIHEAFRDRPVSETRGVKPSVELGDESSVGFKFTRADFEAMGHKGAIWLGAYDGDALIGCVAVTLISPLRARINKLAVLPRVRGMGLGSYLVLHAEREVFAAGVRKMELVCLANDGGLVDFYKRQGYKTVNEKQHRKTEQLIAFMEKRMPHLVDQVGRRVHAYALPPKQLQLDNLEILLVYHPDEIDKPSNTGHVIQRYLPEQTREIIWHRNTIAVQLERHCGSRPSIEFETVLLYPSEEAVALDAFCEQRKTKENPESHEKPLRLVVLDGTWQQAQKMLVQSPVLKKLTAVKLAYLPESQYDLRRNQRDFGLCTLESVGEAFAEMGHDAVRNHLMIGFEEWLELGRKRYK